MTLMQPTVPMAAASNLNIHIVYNIVSPVPLSSVHSSSMQIRLLACEPNDPRVKAALQRLPSDLNVYVVEYGSLLRSMNADPYVSALEALRDGKIDILVAGANIALSEFLPWVFSTFSTSRNETLLYSAASIEPKSEWSPFLLVDPCVVPVPQAEELATMAEGASQLYKALYAKSDPYVAVLSHATGLYRVHQDKLASEAVHEMKRRGKVEVSDAILQLDAAVSIKAAQRKAAHTSRRPNIMLSTDVSVVNVIYKTLEMFGTASVQLSGAIMMGLNNGLIGLLPRTCETHEVSKLLSHLVRAKRGLLRL